MLVIVSLATQVVASVAIHAKESSATEEYWLRIGRRVGDVHGWGVCNGGSVGHGLGDCNFWSSVGYLRQRRRDDIWGCQVLWLRLPLPPPALVRARVGVLVGVLVRVGARRRVEAVAHALPVRPPPHPVGPQLHGHVVPLVEVLVAAVPPEHVLEVVAAAQWDLGEETGVGRVDRGGVGRSCRSCLYDWLVCDGISPCHM